MIFQNAAIHHHREAGLCGAECRRFMDYPFLHPDCFGADANGSFHEVRNELRTPKNIHNVDRLRYGIQVRVALLPQDFGLQRIYRDDPVSDRFMYSATP